MNIYLRHVAPLGFKGSGLFDDSKWFDMYVRENALQYSVTYLRLNAGDYQLGCFHLTEAQWKSFKANKLVLVPPGCCCPTRGDAQIVEDAEVRYNGPIKNVAFLTELLRTLP